MNLSNSVPNNQSARRFGLAAILAATLSGCGFDSSGLGSRPSGSSGSTTHDLGSSGSVEPTTTEGSSGSSTTDSDEVTTDALQTTDVLTTEETTDPGSSSSGEPGPVCGDGAVNEGEECDDGNDVDDDTCPTTCKTPVCGDGFILPLTEACDDGNDVDDDACRNDCSLPGCGDGRLDNGEECDDGNEVDGDGCSAICFKELCGNLACDDGEDCDDGNNKDGDGCEANCSLTPPGECGDGELAWNEACDDGKNCSDGAPCETNAQCAGVGDQKCKPRNGDGCELDCSLPGCGDGDVLDPEECDDNNGDPFDGCNLCKLVPIPCG